MERVLRLVLLMLAMVLIVQTARPHYRYGAWLDTTSDVEFAGLMIPVGMGIVMVVLHIGKAMMLAVAAEFWRRAQRVCSVLAVVLFVMLVLVSITSTFGILDLQRGERAASETTGLKREADLRAELATIEARLKDIGWRRAAAVIESEIAAERRHPFWSSTNGCSDAMTRSHQRYCGALDRLAGELSAAREAEDDRRREKKIRAELLSMKLTTNSAQPDLEFFSQAFDVSVERVGFWRTILFVAAIEAAEALLLLFGSVSARNDGQGRIVRFGSHLCSAYRSAHQWATRKIRRHLQASSTALRDGESDTTPVPQSAPSTAAASGQAMGPKSGRTRAQSRLPPKRDADTELPSPQEDVALSPAVAVAAFVKELARVSKARTTGGALYTAYNARRLSRGWPHISSSTFGRLLKAAVKYVGGRKVKASSQVYVGVALPPG